MNLNVHVFIRWFCNKMSSFLVFSKDHFSGVLKIQFVILSRFARSAFISLNAFNYSKKNI